MEDIPHDPIPVNDSFPDEQLAIVKVQSHSDPWFADYANFRCKVFASRFNISAKEEVLHRFEALLLG